MSRRGIAGAVWSMFAVALAFEGCKGSGSSSDPPCIRIDTPRGQICGKGLVCGDTDGDGNLECIPVACAVLSDCCGFLESEEQAGVSGDYVEACQQTLVTKDGAACDAKLGAIRGDGHCGTRKGIGYLMCEAKAGLGCSPGFGAANSSRPDLGSCCDGLVCQDDVQTGNSFCVACTPAGGTPPDEVCCSDSIFNGTLCEPLRDNGQPCQSNGICWSNLCIDGSCSGARSSGEPCTADEQCVNHVCSGGTCTGGSSSGSSSSGGASSSGGPEACDPSWCNGCTGGGGAYCCSYCTTSTKCDSQCTGTGDF